MFATFTFLFLINTPYLKHDHQAGFRWLISIPIIGRFAIVFFIGLLLSGVLSGGIKRLMSLIKRHRGFRYATGLAIILLLGAGQYLYATADQLRYTVPHSMFCIAAVLVWIAAFRPRAIRKPNVYCSQGVKGNYLLVVLIGIVLFWAVWVRFYRLSEMPPGLWWDEAQTGRVVQSIQKGEFPSVYDLRINAGTIASYLNAAWCFLVDTTDPWGLRSYTAAIGVLTVIASWWFFRQLFSLWWSLFGMALMAGSRWLFTINRTAMATIDETILLTVLILTFYIKVQRKNRIRDHIITGLLLGIAMHLHTGARVLPVIIGVDLIVRLTPVRGPLFRRRLLNASILVFSAIISFAPMGLYIFDHFEDYMKRSQETLLSTEYPGWYPAKPYLDNARYYLEMYTVRGDWHPRHNYSRSPQLAALASILAALGAFLSIGRFRRHPMHRLLILSFCMISIQGILTVHMDGANLNRVAENIPIVFAWAVWGAIFISDTIKHVLKRSMGHIVSICMILSTIGLIWWQEYSIYFNRYLPWPALAEVYGFQTDITEMARLAREIIESDPNVQIWAMYSGGDPFQYIYPRNDRVHDMSVRNPPAEEGNFPKVFLFPANELRMGKLLARAFPDAEKTEIPYSLNPDVPLIVMLKVDFD